MQVTMGTRRDATRPWQRPQRDEVGDGQAQQVDVQYLHRAPGPGASEHNQQVARHDTGCSLDRKLVLEPNGTVLRTQRRADPQRL